MIIFWRLLFGHLLADFTTLPDRPSLKGMPKINSTLGTDAQRKRLHLLGVKPPKLFPPTVQKVKEIVPNKLIPKLKPMTSLTAPSLDRHA